MPITLTEARSAVRDLLHDHAGLLADDAVVDAWLDQGQKDVAALTLCYQRIATFRNTDSPQAFMAGKRGYGFAAAIGGGGLGITDHLRVLHVKSAGVPLMLWTPTMIGWADTQTRGGGTPDYYYEFANLFHLAPYPDAAFLASIFVVELTYGARPADWISGASVLPEAFDQLPIWFAATRVAMQRRHWPLVAQWYAYYLQGIESARLTSLMQWTAPQMDRQQPERVERTDEPRRTLILDRQRLIQRQQSRRGL